jgi:hypothetical protein
MNVYGGVDVEIHIFLTLELAGGEWSASRPEDKAPGTHCIGGGMDPRANLDDVEKNEILTLPGLKLQLLSSSP